MKRMTKRDVIYEIIGYIEKEKGSICVNTKSWKIVFKTSSDKELSRLKGKYLADLYDGGDRFHPPILNYNMLNLPDSILEDALWEMYGENYY